MPDLEKRPLSPSDKARLYSELMDGLFWLCFWIVVATTIVLCTYFATK